MPNRTWTDDDFTRAVAENATISGALRAIRLSTSPGNFAAFHKHVARLGLDTSHFTGKAHGTSRPPTTKSLEEWLVKGSYPHSGDIKRRLIREGLLVEVCAGEGCPVRTQWNGKPLVLQLDHVNGDPFDYRLENLRLLCPNCHSQTTTFTGRSRGRYSPRAEVNTCAKCDKEIG